MRLYVIDGFHTSDMPEPATSSHKRQFPALRNPSGTALFATYSVDGLKTARISAMFIGRVQENQQRESNAIEVEEIIGTSICGWFTHNAAAGLSNRLRDGHLCAPDGIGTSFSERPT